MGLSNQAENFLTAAKLLREKNDHLFQPTYFVVCQAMELALKGFLRGNGGDVEWMKKKIGHNLGAAVIESEKFDLNALVTISVEQKAMIEMINFYYASKDLQYAMTGFKQWPHIDDLLLLTEQIVNGTRQFCVEQRKFHEGKATAVG